MSRYSYRVAAVDAAGNASDSGGPASVTTPDQTAPTAPVELKAVSTSQSVALSWKPATDNVGVKSYVVYRDGLPLTSMSSSVTSFTDNALVGNSAHQYYVKAFDTTDNEGPASNTVTRSFVDTTAPSAPSGLARTLSGFTVRLTWRASTDNVGVQSYTIYRAGVAVGTSSTLAYTDTTPPLGKTSTYTVRARDAAGNLSAASSSVSAAVPADTTRPPRPPGCAPPRARSRSAVTWTASSDNVGVKSYYLFRANAKYKLLGKVTVVHRHRPGHGQEVHLQGLRDRRGRQLERSVGRRQRHRQVGLQPRRADRTDFAHRHARRRWAPGRRDPELERLD